MDKQGWTIVVVAMLTLLPANSVARAQTTQPATWNPATRPAVVVACYQQPVQNLATWRARGCNAVVGPELGNPPRLTVRQYCDAAAREGLWIIGNRKLLEANYRPANLLASALDDEPDASNHNTPPALVRAQAEAFRRLAPDVPVWLNLAGDRITSAGAKDAQNYADWIAAADVVSEDWYPINRQFARYPIALKGQALEYLKSKGARALWDVVECNWQKLNKADKRGRGPTADEIEQQVNLALAKGATGIVYFSTCDSGAYGWPQSYDPTESEQALRITAINARLNPPAATQPTTAPSPQPSPAPAPPVAVDVVALQAKVEEQARAIAALADRQRRFDEALDRIRDAFPVSTMDVAGRVPDRDKRK
jgi:hypothetical protein